MIRKPNTDELISTSRKLGIDIDVLDEMNSKKYIESIIEIFKPFKVTGHLSIGDATMNIPLEDNEFSYSKFLRSESAYIFFDQDGKDRNTVIVVKDATLIGDLMENSFGMEYFTSNEKQDFLIAVNWYGIEVVGIATELLSKMK